MCSDEHALHGCDLCQSKLDSGRPRINSTDPSIKDYLAEEDPWTEFLVLGRIRGAGRVSVVSQHSNEWDNVLAQIPSNQGPTQGKSLHRPSIRSADDDVPIERSNL